MKATFFSCILTIVFSSCISIEEYPNDAQGNFEALWKIIDEHYCFFDYKNIDWTDVYNEFSGKIHSDMSPKELFDTLNIMLQTLKDGHVNLYTPFDVGRYWKWFEDYPDNFNSELVEHYLGNNYAIAGGFRYKILDDNTGYLYYSSFSSAVGDSNLNYILSLMHQADCKGIIIDIRNNGGGLLSNVETIAARFIGTKTLTGYIQHKTGKGHNDFSKPAARYIEPSPENCVKWLKPAVLLINRGCFSAANDFVNAMSYCPNVVTMGDRTGGGSGLPFSSELPIGWSVRFSACPTFDADMQSIEFGIMPDIQVEMNYFDEINGKDTLIETARNLILNL
jgi:hypothetical protein